MSAMMGARFLLPSRLLVLFYVLLPLVVTLGFTSPTPRINLLGSNRNTRTIPCTHLLSDVRETAEAGEPVEEEAAGPERAIRRERHTLFVGNLPSGISDTDLRDLFSRSGTVELVSIPLNKETGEARGFAFVDMTAPEEVEAAVEALAGFSLGGNTIRVSKSLPKEELKKKAVKRDEGGQKIYVGNIPFDAKREDVEDLFSKYGMVRDVFFPIDQATGEPRGFAFVTLDEEDAEKAIEETNGMDFLGRPLTVSMPLPRGEKAARAAPRSNRQKLYVGNLSFYTTHDTLQNLFEEFGEVHDCFMPEDSESGGSRGFGFITMDKEAADAAIKATNGLELDGRIIRVNEAQPKGSGPRRNDDDGDEADESEY